MNFIINDGHILEFKKFSIWFLNLLENENISYLTRYFKMHFISCNNVEFKYFFVFIVFFKNLLDSRLFWIIPSRKSKGYLNPVFSFLHFFGFFFFFVDVIFFDFFVVLIKYLRLVLLLLSPELNVKVEIFLLFNGSVTGAFVSRYIGIKLAQGHSLFAVLIPLVEELSCIGIETVFLSRSSTIFVNEYVNSVSARKVCLNNVILSFSFAYKQFQHKFFNSFCSWLTFFLLWFLMLFYKDFFFEKCFIIGLSKRFFFFKHGFVLFFNYDGLFFFNQLFCLITNFFNYFMEKDLNIVFLSFLFDDFFCNFSLIMYNQYRLCLDSFVLFSVNVFFNRILSFSYWCFNFNKLVAFNSINKSVSRKMPPSSVQGVLGFKLHLRGRFSRHQIASSIWVQQGLTPLNTFSAYIDYGFNTSVLFNSIVSIKVWIYKNPTFCQRYILKFS